MAGPKFVSPSEGENRLIITPTGPIVGYTPHTQSEVRTQYNHDARELAEGRLAASTFDSRWGGARIGRYELAGADDILALAAEGELPDDNWTE